MSIYQFFYLIILIISLIVVYSFKRKADNQSKYDKRLKVFNGFYQFIVKVVQKANASDNDLKIFHDETAEKEFLFDDDITNYYNDVYKKACRLIEIHTGFDDLESFPVNSKTREQLGIEFKALQEWFRLQLDESTNKFKKYLNT